MSKTGEWRSYQMARFSMDMDEERNARLEKIVAATQLRLALETEEERRVQKRFGFNLD